MTAVPADIAGFPLLPDEPARLEALHALDVLDSPAEAEFDDLAWLASQLCQAPIALVSLIDEDRQWFKARCGLDVEQTPRGLAFCAHALGQDTLLEVPNALEDPRFRENALVLGEPHIRFYAGAPLVGSGGHRYGTLCVLDRVPRQLDTVQREALTRLARRTAEALESRQLRRRAEAREQTLERLLDAMPDAVVTCDAQGQLAEFNGQARAWHGLDPARTPASEWAEHFSLYHPDGEQLMATIDLPLARALAGEHVVEAELLIRAAGQPPRLVLCNAEPLHAVSGELLGAVCVMHDITRLRASQDQARVETQRFREAFSAAAQGMALVSLEGRWLDVNNAACGIFGYSRDELTAMDFQMITHPEDLQVDLGLVGELLEGRRDSYQLDKRYFHRSGRVIHAHLAVSLIRDARGAPLHFVSQIQDFTQQRLAERALRQSEQRMRTLADNVPALIAHVDRDMRYAFVNQRYSSWFGKPLEEIVGRHMSEILQPEHFAAVRPRVEAALSGELIVFDTDVVARDGSLRHMQATYVPDHDGFHLMVHDLTAQIRLSRMLQQRALTDTLTGLPNRLAWTVELDLALAHARADRTPLAMLFIDLDRFKLINDTWGHEAGDAVLCAFGQRLRATLRPEDFLARLSGDEFVVRLTGVSDPQADTAVVIEKIRQAMAQPLQAGEHCLQVTPSIGLAVQTAPDYDGPALMHAADKAMYEAKRARAAARSLSS